MRLTNLIRQIEESGCRFIGTGPSMTAHDFEGTLIPVS
jgi:hypothetical protein